jgi:hypothetical protein
MAEAMGEASALGELMQTLLRLITVSSRRYGWDQTIFFESKIGNQVVQLEYETDLVAQKVQQIAVAIDLDVIDGYVPTVR